MAYLKQFKNKLSHIIKKFKIVIMIYSTKYKEIIYE